VVEVIPDLAGRIDGHALRVPVPVGSITDMNFVLSRDVSEHEVLDLLRNVSHHHLQGVLAFSEEALVSTDVIGSSHSTVVDAQMTRVMGNFVKIQAWYDNEYGYSCRCVDIAKMLVE
jgi:glyceraldehyde 3-phosphate dehydrogenase